MTQPQAALTEEPTAFLAFRAGHADFVLPVDRIRYITSLGAISTRSSPDTAGNIHKIFEFEGKIVPLHHFGDLIERRSQTAECAELQVLLAARKQDHIDWIDALEESITTGSKFMKATDPHKCAFGKWYDQYRPTDEILADIMKRFDTPHKRIHSLAENLLSMATDAEGIDKASGLLQAEKHSTLNELLSLFDQASERLKDMLRPVVVILEADAKTFAIELDSIDGMLEFSKADWLADSESDIAGDYFDGYFTKDESDVYLNLIPERLLPGTNAAVH